MFSEVSYLQSLLILTSCKNEFNVTSFVRPAADYHELTVKERHTIWNDYFILAMWLPTGYLRLQLGWGVPLETHVSDWWIHLSGLARVTTAKKSATEAFNPPPSCSQLEVQRKGLAVAAWVGIQSWRKTPKGCLNMRVWKIREDWERGMKCQRPFYFFVYSP